jgi:hypothetical protein
MCKACIACRQYLKEYLLSMSVKGVNDVIVAKTCVHVGLPTQLFIQWLAEERERERERERAGVNT